jgi:hypothetical protein
MEGKGTFDIDGIHMYRNKPTIQNWIPYVSTAYCKKKRNSQFPIIIPPWYDWYFSGTWKPIESPQMTC